MIRRRFASPVAGVLTAVLLPVMVAGQAGCGDRGRAKPVEAVSPDGRFGADFPGRFGAPASQMGGIRRGGSEWSVTTLAGLGVEGAAWVSRLERVGGTAPAPRSTVELRRVAEESITALGEGARLVGEPVAPPVDPERPGSALAGRPALEFRFENITPRARLHGRVRLVVDGPRVFQIAIARPDADALDAPEAVRFLDSLRIIDPTVRPVMAPQG